MQRLPLDRSIVFAGLLALAAVLLLAWRASGAVDYATPHGRWTIYKYASQGALDRRVPECGPGRDYRSGACHARLFMGENIMLRVGVEQALGRLMAATTGTSTNTITAYDSAVSHVMVGSSTTAAAATQTGVISSLGDGLPMDVSYPQLRDDLYADSYDDTIRFRATAAAGVLTGSWQEFAICQGINNQQCLNRLVSNQGTKGAGDVWIVQMDWRFA